MEEKKEIVKNILLEAINVQGLPVSVRVNHDGKNNLNGQELDFNPMDILFVTQLDNVGVDLIPSKGSFWARLYNKNIGARTSFAQVIDAAAERTRKEEEEKNRVISEKERMQNIEQVKDMLYLEITSSKAKFPLLIHAGRDHIKFNSVRFDPRPLLKEAIAMLKKEMQPGSDSMDITVESRILSNDFSVRVEIIQDIE